MLKVLMNVVLCNLTKKMVKQVKIENSYIYGGKFEIKDKFSKTLNNWTMRGC